MVNRKKIDMPKVEPVQYSQSECGFFKRVWRWMSYTRKWRMAEDWYFVLPNGFEIKVPVDFIMDGASVPKVLRGLLSPVGCLFISGIVHDYAYKYNKLIGVNGDGSLYNYLPRAGRKVWDDLFKEIADDINGLKNINKGAWVMVRSFGFIAWNGHRKND